MAPTAHHDARSNLSLPLASPLPSEDSRRAAYAALAAAISERSGALCNAQLQDVVHTLVRIVRQNGDDDMGQLQDGPQAHRGALLDTAHWLEVADEHHRYGTYLRPYYDVWLSSGSRENFFQFLDHGAGRQLDLSQPNSSIVPTAAQRSRKKRIVSRVQLENSRVHYCTADERQQYRAVVQRGRLVWKNKSLQGRWQRHECVHTLGDSTFGESTRWIFVMDLNRNMYLNRKQKGRFHHSSFLAGGRVLSAGRIVVDNGVISLLDGTSGHYKTSPSAVRNAKLALARSGIQIGSFAGKEWERDDDGHAV